MRHLRAKQVPQHVQSVFSTTCCAGESADASDQVVTESCMQHCASKGGDWSPAVESACMRMGRLPHRATLPFGAMRLGCAHTRSRAVAALQE